MKKLFLSKEVDALSDALKILGYKEIDRKDCFFYKDTTRVVFDDSEVKQEYKIKYDIRSTIPFLYIVLSLVVAIILATTYLILSFSLKGQIDTLVYFFILMVPAFVFILIATGLSLRRYFNTIHNLEVIASIALLKKEQNKK